MYKLLDAFISRIPGSVEKLAPIVRQNGMEGLNVPEAMLEDEKKAKEAHRCMIDNGLFWGLIPTPMDFFAADDGEFERGLEKLKKWAAVAEKIGARRCYNHIWPGSNERPYAENFEWHAVRVGRIQRVLDGYGIFYGLECIGVKTLRDTFKYPFIYTQSGINALSEAATGGKTGFLFDTYHWFCSGGRMDDLYFAAQHCDKMVCLHINDGIAGKSAEEQEDLVRALPMTTGVIDSAMAVKLFSETGYKGPVICEPILPSVARFAQMKPEDSIAEIAQAHKRAESKTNLG